MTRISRYPITSGPTTSTTQKFKATGQGVGAVLPLGSEPVQIAPVSCGTKAIRLNKSVEAKLSVAPNPKHRT